MNKKIFLYISLFLVLITKIQTSFGFLSDPLGLDLYEKIDKWVYELELRYVDKELKWWDVNSTIEENLKEYEEFKDIWDCIWDSKFTAEEIQKIANDDNSLELLTKKLEKCSQDWAISAADIVNYQELFKNYYNESVTKAQTKVDNIYKVSRIWLYSDWVEENSPFDLVVDLQEIDKIIFESEIPYDWVNLQDMWLVVDSDLWWDDSDYLSEIWLYNDWVFYDTWLVNNISIPNILEPSINILDWNEFVCKINNSWLSDDFFDNFSTWTIAFSWNLNNSDYFPYDDDYNYWDVDEYWNPLWSYSKVNDNSEFPCNDFFCITIEFVTYSHNLLSFWKSRSIEWFLKQSNKHLKKFVWTSLIQAKMTTNNFEIWLKDLNLPDLFHIWVQVSYKPAPILNLDKALENADGNKKEDNSDFSSENLLYRYYKNLWLDYDRRNDLELFNDEDNEFKSILDKVELPSVAAEESFNELQELKAKIALENEYVSETVIDKKILEDDINDFYNQFVELETFTKAMMDYTINLNAIVKKMRSIPISTK